jgi:hypothetical protein
VIGNVPPAGIVPVPLAPVINTFVKVIFDTIHVYSIEVLLISKFTLPLVFLYINIAYKISNR